MAVAPQLDNIPTQKPLGEAVVAPSVDPTTRLRYEVKFWANEVQAAALVRLASQHMHIDPYCRGGSQRNVSLYLDSPNLTFFELHLAGAPSRSKLRVRTYDDPTGPAFLEVKKRIKGMTMKSRVTVSREDARRIVLGDHDVLRNLKPSQDLSDFIFHYHRYMVSPVILISARRLAMAGSEDGGNFRLTMDRDIRYQPHNGADLIGRPTDWTPVDLSERSGDGSLCVLIEMKFRDAAPAWLAPAIAMTGIQHTSFSKYCACLGRYTAENGNPSRSSFADDGDGE